MKKNHNGKNYKVVLNSEIPDIPLTQEKYWAFPTTRPKKKFKQLTGKKLPNTILTVVAKCGHFNRSNRLTTQSQTKTKPGENLAPHPSPPLNHAQQPLQEASPNRHRLKLVRANRIGTNRIRTKAKTRQLVFADTFPCRPKRLISSLPTCWISS